MSVLVNSKRFIRAYSLLNQWDLDYVLDSFAERYRRYSTFKVSLVTHFGLIVHHEVLRAILSFHFTEIHSATL